jgi:hypothetical protein
MTGERSIVVRKTKFKVTTVEPVPPRRRDFWRVLLGRYEPRVVRRTRLTAAGMSREIKKVWTAPALAALMYDSPLLAPLNEIAADDHA